MEIYLAIASVIAGVATLCLRIDELDERDYQAFLHRHHEKTAKFARKRRNA